MLYPSVPCFNFYQVDITGPRRSLVPIFNILLNSQPRSRESSALELFSTFVLVLLSQSSHCLGNEEKTL